MDGKRIGEIAWILLKDKAEQYGFRFRGLKRDIGNISKRTGIPVVELEEVVRIGLNEILDKSLK